MNYGVNYRRKERQAWISPGQYKNMIDYIIIRRRHKSSSEVQDSRSLTQADCDSDHRMVWANIVGKALCKQQNIKKARKRDYVALLNEQNRAEFENKLFYNKQCRATNWQLCELHYKKQLRKSAQYQMMKENHGWTKNAGNWSNLTEYVDDGMSIVPIYMADKHLNSMK